MKNAACHACKNVPLDSDTAVLLVTSLDCLNAALLFGITQWRCVMTPLDCSVLIRKAVRRRVFFVAMLCKMSAGLVPFGVSTNMCRK